ncbi:MAG: hypothetical protein ACRC6V_01610 [Bacteroidales bacterium]
MSREATYSPSSWEGITRSIKEALGIKCLTKEMAGTIMKMYIAGVSLERILEELEDVK